MFKANLQKLKWCMIWILHQRYCTPEDLGHILFQAEIDHLNIHARPITGVDYFKGPNIYCLEIEKIYSEINPLVKPLDPVNTYHLSISDLNSLQKFLHSNITLNPYLQNLPFGSLIDYSAMISNPEILEYLSENDSYSIVI